MNKRVLILSLLAIIIMLSGCSLAKQELQDINRGDKLRGVFVTFEEALKDYMMQEGDTLYYDEKKLVRADGSTELLTDEEFKKFSEGSFEVEGIEEQEHQYKFGDIDGYYMGYRLEQHKDEDGESYDSCYYISTGDIYNISSATNSSDTEEENTMEATIGITSKYRGGFRINPVYERPDGTIYAKIPGSAILAISDNFSGGSISKSISESYETKITGIKSSEANKENKKQTSKFTVNVEQKDYLESATVLQFDKNYKLIDSRKADLITKEQHQKLEAETSYVIIEEKLVDEKDKEYVKRTTYDCEKVSYTEDNGTEVYNTHTFDSTDENGKIKLILLYLER